MFTLKQLSVLALAGTAFAHPRQGRRDGDVVATVFETVFEYVTETAGAAAPTTTTPVVLVVETPPPTTSAAAFFYEKPQPTTTPAAVAQAPAPVSGGSGYIGIVNQWLSACGKRTLDESSELQANAQDTVNESNGQMVHKLNPGSMGQVLAPGDAGDFAKVFVGGWLCEISTILPGGGCSAWLGGWDHSSGETGHADILINAAYSKIGCAEAAGIWACDLA